MEINKLTEEQKQNLTEKVTERLTYCKIMVEGELRQKELFRAHTKRVVNKARTENGLTEIFL